MTHAAVRRSSVLVLACLVFVPFAGNAFAIGGHYGQEHLTLTIEKVQPAKDGKIEIHYRTLLESVWWCPGANAKKTDAGTELTFVRAFHNQKPKVEYPMRRGEKGVAIIVVPDDGKPIYRVADKKRVEVYPGRKSDATRLEK